MTETIKLKVDRSLIDPKFETYYLANQEIDLQSINLSNCVNEFTLNDKQLYSYLHFCCFSNDFNYLFTDPFNGKQQLIECFFIDNQLNLLKVNLDPSKHSINPPVCVFKLPITNFKANESMVTLSFPSEDLVLILISQCSTVGQIDGHLSLLVVFTGNRQTHQSNEWLLVSLINLTDETSFGSCWQKGNLTAKQLTCPGKLIDSKYQSKDGKETLQLIILNVVKNVDEKFECLLSCLYLSKRKQGLDIDGSPQWTIDRLQQLTGSSYPSYIGVDVNSDEELFLTLVSSRQFRLTYDSCEKPSNCAEDQDESKDSDLERENIYFYYQDDSTITINFKLTEDIQRKEIQVTFGCEEMEIHVKGESVFKEILWESIEKESCTWTLERDEKNLNSLLEVTLIKKNENLTWNQLIKGKELGTRLKSSSEESTANQELNSLIANLAKRSESISGYIPSITGNEQCDEVSEDLILYRFNCNQNSITHQAYLAGHQWLFYRKVDTHLLPCFSLRHDVDACIWQPNVQGSRFHVNHISTFSALGYVQASKESKKFFNCSPDFDYSFIVDSTNHVYIYKQPARCDGIINRKEGIRPKIAKQKVINLGHELIQVLGSIAFKGFLLILSPKKLISIKVDF